VSGLLSEIRHSSFGQPAIKMSRVRAPKTCTLFCKSSKKKSYDRKVKCLCKRCGKKCIDDFVECSQCKMCLHRDCTSLDSESYNEWTKSSHDFSCNECVHRNGTFDVSSCLLRYVSYGYKVMTEIYFSFLHIIYMESLSIL
jgi:hypothetical protein